MHPTMQTVTNSTPHAPKVSERRIRLLMHLQNTHTGRYIIAAEHLGVTILPSQDTVDD
jgi:hypothetical protein